MYTPTDMMPTLIKDTSVTGGVFLYTMCSTMATMMIADVVVTVFESAVECLRASATSTPPEAAKRENSSVVIDAIYKG